MLTKTEKKIRIRVGKRKKYVEEKMIPKSKWIRSLLKFWCLIEKRIKNEK